MDSLVKRSYSSIQDTNFSPNLKEIQTQPKVVQESPKTSSRDQDRRFSLDHTVVGTRFAYFSHINSLIVVFPFIKFATVCAVTVRGGLALKAFKAFLCIMKEGGL